MHALFLCKIISQRDNNRRGRRGGRGRNNFQRGRYGSNNRFGRNNNSNNNYSTYTDRNNSSLYCSTERNIELEKELFDSSAEVTQGINFSNYDKIPVEVSGDNPPIPLGSFDESTLNQTLKLIQFFPPLDSGLLFKQKSLTTPAIKFLH